MKLAAIKSQLSTLEKCLDAVQGKNKALEYVWSSIADGVKTIHAGNPNSMARSTIEIMVIDTDHPDSAPHVFIDGVEHGFNHTMPAVIYRENA